MVHKPKVVLLGESTVGKTSFASRVKHNSFVPDVDATIGCEFFSCEHITTDGTEFRFLIWDTAGQEVFRAFTPQFCRQTAVALLFYDLSDLNTATHLQEWITLSDPACDIVIVPSKSDLCIGNNALELTDLTDLTGDGRRLHHAKPISSKNNTGIKELLEQMSEISLSRVEEKDGRNSVIVVTTSTNVKKSSCC